MTAPTIPPPARRYIRDQPAAASRGGAEAKARVSMGTMLQVVGQSAPARDAGAGAAVPELRQSVKLARGMLVLIA